MKKNIEKEEYDKAREQVQQSEKQQIIDSFEKDGTTKTNYSIKDHGDTREFFYGVPVMDGGKLQGFNMMKFVKFYDEIGCGFSGDDEPYTDENCQQIFMTVDEYYKFYKELEQKDGRLGSLLHKAREQENIEDIVLSNSKLAKFRKNIAKFADKVAERLGMEKVVKKVTKGKKIEEVKIGSGAKAKERDFSDKFFGRTR